MTTQTIERAGAGVGAPVEAPTRTHVITDLCDAGREHTFDPSERAAMTEIGYLVAQRRREQCSFSVRGEDDKRTIVPARDYDPAVHVDTVIRPQLVGG